MEYPRMNQWKQPVFPHPETGKECGWIRASTVAKVMGDGGGLINWTGVMVAGGCYLRPDLVGRIGANWPMTDVNKDELYSTVDDLKDAGGGNVGRNLGNNLHEFLRRRNQGEKFRAMPPYDADIQAHDELVAQAGLVIDPRYVERTVCHPDLGVAGSFDLAARVAEHSEDLYIIDYKTGAVRDYVWPGWIVQTCLYANAPLLYDWEAGKFEPMPPVSKTRAFIISLPVGSAKAEMFVLDISAAWEAVKTALWVYQYRKDAKKLARPARLNGASS